MERVNDLLNTIFQGNIITSLDILKGYWKISLEEIGTLRHSKRTNLNIGGR